MPWKYPQKRISVNLSISYPVDLPAGPKALKSDAKSRDISEISRWWWCEWMRCHYETNENKMAVAQAVHWKQTQKKKKRKTTTQYGRHFGFFLLRYIEFVRVLGVYFSNLFCLFRFCFSYQFRGFLGAFFSSPTASSSASSSSSCIFCASSTCVGDDVITQFYASASHVAAQRAIFVSFRFYLHFESAKKSIRQKKHRQDVVVIDCETVSMPIMRELRE